MYTSAAIAHSRNNGPASKHPQIGNEPLIGSLKGGEVVEQLSAAWAEGGAWIWVASSSRVMTWHWCSHGGGRRCAHNRSRCSNGGGGKARSD